MKITKVTIMPVKSDNISTKAYASITLDGVFAVNDIRIMDGKNGLFVAFPNKKGKDKDGKEKYYDICNPTTAELRKEINDAVIAKYNETVAQPQTQPDAGTASRPADDNPFSGDEDDPFKGLRGW